MLHGALPAWIPGTWRDTANLQKIMPNHQGMGEVASPKSLDGGEKINSILNFCDSAEGIYDAFINPKYKVSFNLKVSSRNEIML